MRGANIWYLKRPLDNRFPAQHNELVSTILLQENSFKPAQSGLFFALIFMDSQRWTDVFVLCHIHVIRGSYTQFICSTRNRYA